MPDFSGRHPIKAFGAPTASFEEAVLAILRRHVPDIGCRDVYRRPSRQGRYVALTVTVTVDSREQLEAIYRDLAAHHEVLMTL